MFFSSIAYGIHHIDVLSVCVELRVFVMHTKLPFSSNQYAQIYRSLTFIHIQFELVSERMI